MIISILGLAGSGKSTQSDLIAQKTGLIHISVGQLLRKTHHQHLREYMKVGQLINPAVVNGLLQEELDKLLALDMTKGILVDGYPREMAQAEWLINHQYNLKVVILIKITVEEATRRLLARKRLDDSPEAIKNRLKIFKLETEPVINYLKTKGVFVLEIDGMGTIEQTHQKIMEQIEHVITTN